MPEHARRIKIRRKALRQPDEFHTLTSQAMAWLDAHREFAAGIALAALVAAAAVVAVSQYRASQVGRAAESFRAAQATFEARHFADAAAAFEVLGETYPRTPSGRLAGLYRAHAREGSGDATGALEAYTQAAALEGPYRQDALLGEARLQEAAGNVDAARGLYARLLKESQPDPDLRTLLLSKLPPGTEATSSARP